MLHCCAIVSTEGCAQLTYLLSLSGPAQLCSASSPLATQQGGTIVQFEIRRSNSASQPYYWRIVASNGQVLATSETYVAKQSAINAVQSVKSNAGSAPIYDYTT